MIPRPFDRPVPPPVPTPELPVVDTIPATIIEIVFPSDKIVLTLFDGDHYSFGGDDGEAIMIEYADNPRLGRFAEKFMIFRTHAYYMSERKVMMEVPREPFKPSGEVSQLAAVPDEDDQSAS